MAHLPQYVQLDEDHLGASRLLEVLCSVYGFPMDIADKKEGEQQYRDIDGAVDLQSDVGSLIKQLETYYDKVLSRPSDHGSGADRDQGQRGVETELVLIGFGGTKSDHIFIRPGTFLKDHREA